MIELSDLRKYNSGAKTARLEAKIKFLDLEIEAPAETLWFEIDANYSAMLVDDTYDPFLLAALYLAMNYKTDLKIRGNVSKKLFKNLTWYGQKILCDFSEKLSPVKIIVEGFAPTQATGVLIGGGMSGGVDSMSTLYDRFICEDDPDYKINALFFFNCGSNGIEDVASSQQTAVRLYPNPAQSYCVVSNTEGELMDVTVYSMTGAKMMETTVENEGRIDISSLKTGVYMVKINNHTTKLVKW